MNKKRFISLAMALVMILGVFAMAMVTVSADSTFDYRTALEADQGNFIADGRSHEVVLLANSPDTTDGVIGENEYASSRADWACRQLGESREYWDKITHYIAHDADYIYIAFDLPTYDATKDFDLYLYPLQIFDNASASYMDYEALIFTIAGNSTTLTWKAVGAKQGDVSVHVNAGRFATDATTFGGKVTKAAEGTSAVVETMFSKAALAEAASLTGVADFTNIRFMVKYYGTKNADMKHIAMPVQNRTLRQALRATTTTELSTLSYTSNWNDFWPISANLVNAATTTAAPTTATTATTATTTATTAATTKKVTTAKATTAATTTAAPATTAAETTAATTAAEEKGCGGTLTVSALALLPIIAGGAWIVRKKED